MLAEFLVFFYMLEKENTVSDLYHTNQKKKPGEEGEDESRSSPMTLVGDSNA